MSKLFVFFVFCSSVSLVASELPTPPRKVSIVPSLRGALKTSMGATIYAGILGATVLGAQEIAKKKNYDPERYKWLMDATAGR